MPQSIYIQLLHQENKDLEKERDKLKGQHDDRPEEEKDSLQDLRLMHASLEKEIKELKDIMLEFIPPANSENDGKYLSVKEGVELITEMQR